MRSLHFLFAALTLVVLSALPAAAYTMEPDFYTLSDAYVSPHIAWGKPYAGGRVKALFICPRGDAREVIEVAERLDLDYQVVMTLSSDELGWTSKSGPYAPAEGISNEEMIRECAQKLQGKYDVIVAGQIKWDMFPRELLYTIMEKVNGGTGLVVGYSDYGRNALVDRLFAKPAVQTDYLTMGVPLKALPVLDKLDPAKAFQTRQFRDGRMALLSYPGRPFFMFLTPFPPDTDESYRELHYEYYQSLVCKAILWAAKKEPQVQFTEIGVGGDTINRTDLPKTKLIARWRGITGGMLANITVRDEDNHVFAKATQELPGKELTFPLPTLPAGKYFADIIIKAGQNSVSWGSAAFTVTSDPGIASLTLEPIAVKPGGTAEATVALSAPATANLSVALIVRDNLDRTVARKDVAVPAGAHSVKVPFQMVTPLATSADVTAYLLPAAAKNAALPEASLDHATQQLFVALKRSRGNYGNAVWSASGQRNDFVRRLMMPQMRAADVDLQTNSSPSIGGQQWLQKYNFDTIPYATRYSYEGTDNVRKPCLTDPKFLTGHLEGLEKIGRELGPMGPRAYTLGDECFLARNGTDVCFSPSCIADLQQWLQGQYKDIAALNASWGTDYKSFSEAQPITLPEAKKLNQPARWVDHRRHMEFVYARMMQRAEDAIRKGDPEAEVGFDGPFDTSSFSGNDWSQLMDTFDMCNVYFHQPTQWEFLRSFAKPDMLLGLWYGGYFEHRTQDEERLWPWRGIFNGFNSMWWYNVYHGNSGICPMDALDPSMELYPAYQWAMEEMKELRAGEGQALMNSTRLDDGIGIHYSQPSLHAATWSGDFGRLDGEWLQCFQTLEDMGLQYTCRAYDKIEKEGVDAKRFTVFILPYSQAISPAEAAAFRKYVADGGLLIADVRPGLYDQHGKPQSPGMLDDLFGIKRVTGTGIVKNQPAQIALPDGKTFALKSVDVDGDVQVTDGKPYGTAGQVPVLIYRTTGKGATVLMNYSFAAPARSRLDAEALPQWGVLQAILATKGVEPQARVAVGGDPVRLLETVRFQDGPIEYVGFLKNRVSRDETTAAAQVTMPAAAHTYDLRGGKYLGKLATWQADFVPARARLYARLPYTIDGVKVATTKQAANVSGQLAGAVLTCNVSLQTSAKQPGRHWVALSVYGPDGKLRQHYSRNIATANGKATTNIPLALDDAKGTWKVVAREVISGKKAEATFSL
jgi:hypothetical protein